MAMQVVIDGSVSAKSVRQTVPARGAPGSKPRTRPNIHPGGLHEEPALAARQGTRINLGEPGIQVIVDDDHLEVRVIGILRESETEVTDRFGKTFGAGVGEVLESDGELAEEFADTELRHAQFGPKRRDRGGNLGRFDHETCLCQLGKRLVDLLGGDAWTQGSDDLIGCATAVDQWNDQPGDGIADEGGAILAQKRHSLIGHDLGVVASADMRADG